MIDGRGLGDVMAYSFGCAPSLQSANFAQPPQGAGKSGSNGRLATDFSQMVLRRISGVFSSSIALGGYRAWGCQALRNVSQLRPNRARKSKKPAAEKLRSRELLCTLAARQPSRSGAGAGLDCAVGAISVDVERTGRSLHHFARDPPLFAAFQSWKIDHGLELDAFQDRREVAGSGFAFD